MNSDNDMMKQVWLMLRTILKGQGHLHRIGGYVCGRTSNDDPYIILYPDGDLLVHKAVRVYKEQLKQLPPFINLDNIEDDAGGGNPDKEKAKKRGIYRECPLFEVMTYDGKDTQMGPEKRFSGVLRIVPQRNSPPPPQATATTPPPSTTPPLSSTPPASTTATATQLGQGGQERWLKEAAAAANGFLLTTALQKLLPDVSVGSLHKSIELFYAGGIADDLVLESELAHQLTVKVMAYWDARRRQQKFPVAIANESWARVQGGES